MKTSRQRFAFIMLGLLFISGLALLGVGVLTGSSNRTARPIIALSTLQVPTTLSGELDPKLASVLGQLLVVYQSEGPSKARDFAISNRLMDADGVIRLTLDLDTEDPAEQQEVVQQLEALGARIETRYPSALGVSFTLDQLGAVLEVPTPGPGTPLAVPATLIPGSLPPTVLERLSQLKHIKRVHLPEGPSPRNLLRQASSEGVAVMNADDWHNQGVDGRGIKVAVLDPGGFLGYEKLLGTSLPPTGRVHVRAFNRSSDIEGNSWDDEDERVHGTACAEIIHALAPNAELYLVAFDEDETEAVEWLLSEGVTIISASYGTNAYRTDGTTDPSSRLVNRVRDQGVLWVNSAGNEADLHHMGTLTQGADGLNTFRNGSSSLGLQAKGAIRIILRWEDWQSRSIDYDLGLADENGNVVARSQDIQDGSSNPPREILRYQAPQGQYYIFISAAAGAEAVRYDIFVNGTAELEDADAAESLGSPGDAEGAFTVGAVEWQTETRADYSSEGPTADGRLKPEISAPAGVTSCCYQGGFGGTSAAAPHVAGAAALFWSANPQAEANEVRDYLLSHAHDLGVEGPDVEYGYGRVDMGVPPTALAGAQLPSATPRLPVQIQPTRTSTSVSNPQTPGGQVPPTWTPTPQTSGPRGSSGSNNLLLTLGFGMVLGSILMGGGMWLFGRLRHPKSTLAAQSHAQPGKGWSPQPPTSTLPHGPNQPSTLRRPGASPHVGPHAGSPSPTQRPPGTHLHSPGGPGLAPPQQSSTRNSTSSSMPPGAAPRSSNVLPSSPVNQQPLSSTNAPPMHPTQPTSGTPAPASLPLTPPKAGGPTASPPAGRRVFCPSCRRVLNVQTGNCDNCGWKGP